MGMVRNLRMDMRRSSGRQIHNNGREDGRRGRVVHGSGGAMCDNSPKIISGSVPLPTPTPAPKPTVDSVALDMDPDEAEEFMRQMRSMADRKATAIAEEILKKQKERERRQGK